MNVNEKTGLTFLCQDDPNHAIHFRARERGREREGEREGGREREREREGEIEREKLPWRGNRDWTSFEL